MPIRISEASGLIARTTMQHVSSFRSTRFAAWLVAAGVVSGSALLAPHAFLTPALAQQAPECVDIGNKLNTYGQWMQRAQNFQKKKPTPDEACNVFTNLQRSGSAVVPALEQNGAWCHVPDQALANIKAQQEQITKVRAEACKVAAQMKKQQQQGAQGGGLLGGGDVLGGPMRVPQGAL